MSCWSGRPRQVAICSTGSKALRQSSQGWCVDVRGRGLMCAFSLPTAAQRDDLIRRLWERRVIMLASGPTSVRFRPALTVSRDEIDAAVAAVRDALSQVVVG